MNVLPQIMIHLNSLSESSLPPGSSSPKDIENPLFEDLFKKNMDAILKGDWGSSLFTSSGIDQKTDVAKTQSNSNVLLGPNRKWNNLGIPISQMILPGSASGKLADYLKTQGLGQDEINSLLASVTDSTGLIHLDKLLTKLSQVNISKDAEKDQSVIPIKDIPRVEEMFFNLGLGAGEIKNLIEKSMIRQEGLSLEQLSSALKNISGGQISQQDLNTLLQQYQIVPKSQGVDNRWIEQQMKSFQELSQTTSSDSQQVVKNSLANEQTLLQTQERNDQLQQLNDLFNGVMIKPQKEMQVGPWQQNIQELMKKANLLKTEGNETSNKISGNLSNVGQEDPATSALELKIKNASGENMISLKNDLYSKLSQSEDLLKGLKKIDNQSGATDDLSARNAITIARLDPNGLKTGQIDSSRNFQELPQPLPKIVEQMVWMSQAGEQKSRMTIVPPELGRVDLELVMKNGHLQANLGAENAAVKGLIDANLGQLKQQLAGQGIIVDHFEVMVGLNQHSYNQDQTWAGEYFKDQQDKRKANNEDVNPVEEIATQVSDGDYTHQIDVHI